jgi:hypothetical protein
MARVIARVFLFTGQALLPAVVDAQHPFQRVQFKRTQVFFGEVAEPTDHLLSDMALFDGARPDPGEPL